MMRHSSLTLILAATIISLSSISRAQTPAGGSKVFENDWIKFGYPADWLLAEKTDAKKQHILLKREDSAGLIEIIVAGDLVSTYQQFEAVRQSTIEPLIENLIRMLSKSNQRAQREDLCTQLGGSKTLPGVLVRGVYQGEPSTAEIYSAVLKAHFVGLIYLRADREKPQTDLAWEMIRQTIEIKTVASETGHEKAVQFFSAGVMNGKALKLPKPEYPYEAQRKGLSGTVLVKVLIDEEGKVISVVATQGHSVLATVSERAARRAIFSPTLLCGEPVRIVGTIQYRFVP